MGRCTKISAKVGHYHALRKNGRVNRKKMREKYEIKRKWQKIGKCEERLKEM
jgi:hypothetical protein